MPPHKRKCESLKVSQPSSSATATSLIPSPIPPAIPKPQFYNLLPNIQPHVAAAHNTVPAWQHVNGVPNINYNTGPYTPDPPLPWGQQYTAQQPMLQYPPQQCFPTQPPSTNHFPAHSLPSPVLSLPPTPRTTHAPPMSFPILAGMAPRPPRPMHQQDPCRSPAPPNAPSRYSEYSEMSAMRAAILGIFEFPLRTSHATQAC
jgi:hypothetical protein